MHLVQHNKQVGKTHRVSNGRLHHLGCCCHSMSRRLNEDCSRRIRARVWGGSDQGICFSRGSDASALLERPS